MTPVQDIPATPFRHADILDAARRLGPVAIRTPVLRSDALNHLAGCEVHLKAENLQRTGSFKFRGAYNAIASLSAEHRLRGVVTYSSGNHGQAVALAATLLGTEATVVMPEDAPRIKLSATRSYGAEVVLYDRTRDDRAALAATLAETRGLTLVRPYDDLAVMAGQGTAGLELVQGIGGLDSLLVCVSGGGLLAGCATAAKALQPKIDVFGVEPLAMPRTARSLAAGERITVPMAETVADALQAQTPGSLTFPVNAALVSGMFAASDQQMLLAVTTLFDLVKIAAEPSGAIALAGLLAHREQFAGQRVGVIVSGGNVSLEELILLNKRSRV